MYPCYVQLTHAARDTPTCGGKAVKKNAGQRSEDALQYVQ